MRIEVVVELGKANLVVGGAGDGAEQAGQVAGSGLEGGDGGASPECKGA